MLFFGSWSLLLPREVPNRLEKTWGEPKRQGRTTIRSFDVGISQSCTWGCGQLWVAGGWWYRYPSRSWGIRILRGMWDFCLERCWAEIQNAVFVDLVNLWMRTNPLFLSFFPLVPSIPKFLVLGFWKHLRMAPLHQTAFKLLNIDCLQWMIPSCRAAGRLPLKAIPLQVGWKEIELCIQHRRLPLLSPCLANSHESLNLLPGAEGYVWQVTLSVDAAGRIQGDGHPIKRKKHLLHARKNSTAVEDGQIEAAAPHVPEMEMDVEAIGKGWDGKSQLDGKTFHDAVEHPSRTEVPHLEPEEEDEEDEEDEHPKPRRKKRVADEDSECEDDEVTFEAANTLNTLSSILVHSIFFWCKILDLGAKSPWQEIGYEHDCEEPYDGIEDESFCGSRGSEPREVDRSTLNEDLLPLHDCIAELTETLENYNGDLGQAQKMPSCWMISPLIEVLHNFGFGMLHFDTSNPHSETSSDSSSRAVHFSFWQVLRSYKQLFEHFRAVRKNKKMRHEFEECGLESKFDHLHDLLCEHDIEEDGPKQFWHSGSTQVIRWQGWQCNVDPRSSQSSLKNSMVMNQIMTLQMMNQKLKNRARQNLGKVFHSFKNPVFHSKYQCWCLKYGDFCDPWSWMVGREGGDETRKESHQNRRLAERGGQRCDVACDSEYADWWNV